MRLWLSNTTEALPRLSRLSAGPITPSVRILRDSTLLQPLRIQNRRLTTRQTRASRPSNFTPFLSSKTVTTMSPSIDHRSERRTRRYSSTAVPVDIDGTPNLAFAFEYEPHLPGFVSHTDKLSASTVSSCDLQPRFLVPLKLCHIYIRTTSPSSCSPMEAGSTRARGSRNSARSLVSPSPRRTLCNRIPLSSNLSKARTQSRA